MTGVWNFDVGIWNRWEFGILTLEFGALQLPNSKFQILCLSPNASGNFKDGTNDGESQKCYRGSHDK